MIQILNQRILGQEVPQSPYFLTSPRIQELASHHSGWILSSFHLVSSQLRFSHSPNMSVTITHLGSREIVSTNRAPLSLTTLFDSSRATLLPYLMRVT